MSNEIKTKKKLINSQIKIVCPKCKENLKITNLEYNVDYDCSECGEIFFILKFPKFFFNI